MAAQCLLNQCAHCSHAYFVICIGCNSAGFIQQTTGTCPVGTSFIETNAGCAAAAQSLGLSSATPGVSTTVTNPFGCYFKEGNSITTQLWFNPSGDRNDDDTDRVSLCQCSTGMNARSNCVTRMQLHCATLASLFFYCAQTTDKRPIPICGHYQHYEAGGATHMHTPPPPPRRGGKRFYGGPGASLFSPSLVFFVWASF